MNGRMIDLHGKNFNRLKVLEFMGTNKHNNALWRCECECGNEVTAPSSDLRSGHTKSCGCYHIDKVTKHGKRYTKLYGVYQAMKDRCLNENHKSYVNYGGRGISICDEWVVEGGINAFYEWAHKNGYKEGLTLDRIDNDGNYKPSNCRWTDYKTQNNNTRKTIAIEINGVSKTLSEWSEEYSIKKTTLMGRINNGWEDDVLLSPPSNTPRKYRR